MNGRLEVGSYSIKFDGMLKVYEDTKNNDEEEENIQERKCTCKKGR